MTYRSKMKRKVYIVNKSSHDFSPAEIHGELVYLTEGELSPFNTNEMYRKFQPYIANSNPTDYILITSLTVMNVILTSMFTAKHGKLNLLLYRVNRAGEVRYILRSHNLARGLS